MTLENIQKGIDDSAAKNDLAITIDKVDSDCFTSLLGLLRRKNEIKFATISTALEANKTKLIITGKSDLIEADNETTITLVDTGTTTRECIVTAKPVADCTLTQLVKGRVFIIDDKFSLDGFPSSFSDVLLEAKSESGNLKFTGKAKGSGAASSFSVFTNPRIALAQVEFELTTFFIPQLRSIEAAFQITGLLTVGKEVVKAGVRFPIRSGDGALVPGAWIVTLDAASGPVKVPSLAELETWLGAGQIFSAAPAEITALGDFGLTGLTIAISLPGAKPSVDSMEVRISTGKGWEFEASSASRIALTQISIVVEILTPFSSPTVSARVEGQVVLADVVLNVLMSLAENGREWLISMSTSEPAEFSLDQLKTLVGGFDLTTLDLPSTNSKIGLSLDELTFAVDLRATSGKKFRSLKLDATMAFNPKWQLVESVLSLGDAQFSLELKDSLSAPTPRVSASLYGVLEFLQDIAVEFEMTRAEKRWMLTARAEDVPLLSTLEKLGIRDGLPAALEKLTIADLTARFATGTPTELSLSATIEKAFQFPLAEGFSPTIRCLSVEFLRAQQTSMTLSGTITFENVRLLLVFAYNGKWRVMIEALGLRGEYEAGVARIDLGDKTIGDLVQAFYSLVQPGTTMRLPEPWNVLDGVSLENLSLEIDFAQRSFKVTKKFTPEVDFGFTKLRSVEVSYTTAKKVRLKLTPTAGPLIDIDPSNPGSDLPLAKGKKSDPIDIQFLALGQRLSLKNNPANVRGALTSMRESFKAGDLPADLFKPDSALSFNAQSRLLIGAEFTLLDTLSMAMVFNDGTVAGVSIGVNGERARYFRRLAFEILYKKVSDGIGVYQIELALPESLRQIELGQVSVTMPHIELDIYTSGKFRLDLGFPKKNDFSRSFQLQVFPFIGSGGFYFALPEVALAKRLPGDYKPERGSPGTFGPVFAFGLGLSIGLGKSIRRGILVAELSLTFEGIVEGVLAFYNGEGKAPDSIYYWMQGTLGIVVRIRGVVRFSVITADVSIVLVARIAVTLESFQPVVLSFIASVNVDLVVQIGTGWLSANISCSFSTQISEEFVIPVRNPGVPAWVPPAEPQQLPRMSRQIGRLTTARLLAPPASQPIPAMTWVPIDLGNDPRDELRLLFRPQFTVAEVDGLQKTQCVALLFLKSVGPPSNNLPAGAPPRTDPSEFDRLAEAMLLWSIHSLDTKRDKPVESRAALDKLTVSSEELRGIYRVLTQKDKGAAPFTAAEVTDFLRQYFELVIEARRRPPEGVKDKSYYTEGRPTVAMFPMIPELRVETRVRLQPGGDEKKEYEQVHYTARFDQQTVVPLTYHEEIREHFRKLDSEFRTDVEIDTDREGADPIPLELPQVGGRSVAEFVFEDYFLLIARAVVQKSLDLIKNYTHEIAETETIDDVSSRFDIPVSELAIANATAALRAESELRLPGGDTYIARSGDTLTSVAATSSPLALAALLEANKSRTKLFAAGQKLVLPRVQIGTLRTKLFEGTRYQDVAGMASRFLLPGLTLPRPAYLADDVRALWREKGKTPEGIKTYWPAPLYAITGQQFELPQFARTAPPPLVAMLIQDPCVGCTIDLIPPEEPAVDFRYVMAGDGARWPETEDVDKVSIQLEDVDLDWIEDLREAKLSPPIKELKRIEPCRTEPRRFALGNRTELTAIPPLKFDGEVLPSTVSTLWTLEDGLRRALTEQRETPPSFSIERALQRPGGALDFVDVRPCCWATALPVRVHKVLLPDGKALPRTYEIDGMDPDAILLLEQILRRGASDGGFIKDARIFYRPEKPGDVAELKSERVIDGINAFILRTNLSTLTSPPASVTARESGEAESPTVTTLRRLWEASAVGSGYYLYYRAGDEKSSLPEHLFETGTAEITVMVIFGFSGQEVAPFVNRAIVGNTTAAGAMLFATSQAKEIKVPVDSTTSIPALLSSYRVSLDDLAKAIASEDLIPGRSLGYEQSVRSRDSVADWTIVRGSYTTQSGDTLQKIARQLEVPLAELVFRNAGDIAFTTQGQIALKDQLTFRQPTLLPGHVGFELRRARLLPRQDDPPAAEQIQYLYSLLGCRVLKNQQFEESAEAAADGPQVDEQGPLAPWVYTKVIPAFKFFTAPVMDYPDKLFPNPRRNPHRGNGETLAVRLDWLDGFGNKTLSPFHPGPGTDPPEAVFPLRVGYTDELIGVGRWPAVSAGYVVKPADKENAEPYLQVTLDFDVSRYTPLGTGQRSGASSKRAAQADLEVFRRIHYQLNGTKIRVRTTMDNFKEEEVGQEPVWDFIRNIARYLGQIASQGYSPAIASPAVCTLKRPVSLSNRAGVFPLTVRLELERDGYVDGAFLDVPAVRKVTHEIEPRPIVGRKEDGQSLGAIREFAREFEAAFAATVNGPDAPKVRTVKLASGISRASDLDSDSRNRLWVVQIGGENGVRYEVNAGRQHFFAPIPLASTLLSKANLSVYDFSGEKPMPSGKSYSGIDLDEWAGRFLNTMDAVLLPQHAVPAYAIDQAHFTALINAKKAIATAIEKTVEGIAEGSDGELELKLARELLRDRLLTRLSAAYEIDTIVQVGLTVTSSHKDTELAPRLYGQPIATLPAQAAQGKPPEELDFTLSTAKIPLANGQSYLTLLFDSKKAKPEQRLRLKLSYEATAFEHEIAGGPAGTDLKASSWLTFLVPEVVIAKDKAAEIEIPLPIRACPISPVLNKQSVSPTSDLSKTGLKIEDTRQYSYRYDYTHLSSGHDLVYTSPRFNYVAKAESKAVEVGGVDLFQALASFDRVRDKIEGLLTKLPAYDQLDDPSKSDAKNALGEFARLATAVGDAWGKWHSDHRKKYETTADNPEDYLYVISEMNNEKNNGWQIIVRKCVGPDDAPIPIVQVGEWTPVVDSSTEGQQRIQFEKSEGVLATAGDVKDKRARTVVFEALDILHKQTAWAGVRMTRNETLFGDVACRQGDLRRTNRRFIYRTPTVRFAEVLTPLLTYPHEIGVANLPVAQLPQDAGPYVEPREASLEGHLVRLFTRFFESVAKDLDPDELVDRRIQLTCRYEYRLDGPFAHLITLPIVMAPPFDFVIRDGWKSNCRQGTKSFLCSLKASIDSWYKRRVPSKNQGAFTFDISVYSSLGAGKLPIYRLSNLRLPLETVVDLVE